MKKKDKTNLEQYIGKTLDEMTQADWDKVEEAIETFTGKRANMDKMIRYRKLVETARQMKQMWLADTSKPSPDHMHAGIFLDCNRWCSLTGEDAERFTHMCELADDISFTAPDTRDPEFVGDASIRVSFFLFDVWEKDF